MLKQIFEEFLNYSQTQSYREGLYLAASGLVLQVIVLSLLTAVAIKIFYWRRDKKARILIDFYIFQIYHILLRGFISAFNNIGSKNQTQIANEATKHSTKRFRSFTYGNLENLITWASEITKDQKDFQSRIDNSSAEDIVGFLDVTNDALFEVDRIVLWVQGNRKAIWELHQLRAIFRILRDQLSELSDQKNDCESNAIPPPFLGDLNRAVGFVINQISSDFQNRRKLVDKHTKISDFSGVVLLALSLLWILPARPILIFIAKIRNRPFIDPWSPSIFPAKLAEWRSNNNFDMNQAALQIGVSEKQYRNYEMGYSRLEMQEIFGPFRQCFISREQSETEISSGDTQGQAPNFPHAPD